jgi:hypothetical protein
MPDTFTPNLNLTQPEIGGSADTWGTKLNANMATLDTAVAARALASRQIVTAPGSGLTGGGPLTGDVTLAVAADVVRTTRQVTAGAGLTGGGTLAGDVALGIAALGVTSGMLADGAVVSDKISANAVVTSKINNGAVTTPKLADGAVTTPKLADASVTGAKMVFDSAFTAAVLAVITSLSPGAVGTTMLCRIQGGVTLGNTYAGSLLQPASLVEQPQNSGNFSLQVAPSSLSGTWRALATTFGGTGFYTLALFVRIS